MCISLIIVVSVIASVTEVYRYLCLTDKSSMCGLLEGINKPQVAVYCRSHILTSADQKVTPWLVPIMLSIIHHTYSYPS